MTLGKLKPYFFKYHKLMHFCTGSTILCFSLKFIYILYSILKLCNIHTRKALTLFQRGRGGVFLGPPLTFFGYNSRSIGLRLFKFFTFLTNSCSLTLWLKAGVLYLLPESSGLLPECLILPLSG